MSVHTICIDLLRFDKDFLRIFFSFLICEHHIYVLCCISGTYARTNIENTFKTTDQPIARGTCRGEIFFRDHVGSG